MMVQRSLSCHNVRAARLAMGFSGIVVVLQFGLFMLLGLGLRVYFGGQDFARGDDIFPHFIVHELNPVLRGLMLAGLFSAAMSTLSSSINSLSASTVLDIMPTGILTGVRRDRLIAAAWTVVLVGVSLLFGVASAPLVELGLKIASITYGSMLGIFLLAIMPVRVGQTAVLTGFAAGVIVMAFVALADLLFWPWLVMTGCAMCILVALLVHGMALQLRSVRNTV
jgi:Na+/proline symporter